MKTIAKPTITVREVFLKCISSVDDAKLKDSLTNCVETLEAAETDFDKKFNTHEIYQISRVANIYGPIGKDQMKVVYDYRMVKVGMPGRKYYDQIMDSAPNGKCPLCSVRIADTLDHYLPKMKYPVYSVTPLNLVPACIQCNKGKLTDYPTSSEEQSLHPYYDDVENELWIKANVLQTTPVSLEYFASPPTNWSHIQKDRVVFHFATYNLNGLFSSHANEELRGAIGQMINLYNNDPQLLRAHLRECHNSRLALGINSWQAVMYGALLNDEWFCKGGVLI